MATIQLSAAPSSVSNRILTSFEGLRPSTVKISSFGSSRPAGPLSNKTFRGPIVQAATVVAPKFTKVAPLGDRVLVKIKTAEEKTQGGILLPTTAQTKPQSGVVVSVGEGKSIGKIKLVISVKYVWTELEFNGSNHRILKEDDIVGILDTEDIKDLKPLNDRVLIKVTEAEEKTAGGLYLTEATKEKPSIGTVIAVGLGPLDEEGNRKALYVAPGNTYAGNDFKGVDSSDYIALRASDVVAVFC
ncbi:GroES chaperonin family [Dillenia turbinata]|uniref:20 kDa chaperonin, chloroplastic n=1 Tax=Dillenia turbinata TaxID=194707 RepID=A0AAN8V837_9MAGN